MVVEEKGGDREGRGLWTGEESCGGEGKALSAEEGGSNLFRSTSLLKKRGKRKGKVAEGKTLL